jgi:AcrR family transcriptional regulator
MKKVTATDLRTIRTKKAIHQAFQEMATSTNIEHITVKELAALAGINRKTFYCHYDSIDALEKELLGALVQDIQRIIENEQPHEFRDTLENIYRFLCDLPIWYRNLMCSKDSPISQQIFMEFIGSHLSRFQSPMSPAQMLEYMKLRYIAATSIELFRVWHETGGTMPVDDFVAAATGLVCFGEQHI